MAATYKLISSNTLTTATASVTFSSIPSTYTDLVLKISARGSTAAGGAGSSVRLNGSSGTNYSERRLINFNGTSTQAACNSGTAFEYQVIPGDSATSNTFGSMEVYIPSYLSVSKHPISFAYISENISTTSNQGGVTASLWSDTSAVTSFTIAPSSGNFLTGSSFYLYGISNS